MSRTLKLIWDFKGEDAKKIAEHHCVHLKEFTAIEQLHFFEISTSEINKMYTIAYIIVDEKDMITYRDALKPHRGEIV